MARKEGMVYPVTGVPGAPIQRYSCHPFCIEIYFSRLLFLQCNPQNCDPPDRLPQNDDYSAALIV